MTGNLIPRGGGGMAPVGRVRSETKILDHISSQIVIVAIVITKPVHLCNCFGGGLQDIKPDHAGEALLAGRHQSLDNAEPRENRVDISPSRSWGRLLIIRISSRISFNDGLQTANDVPHVVDKLSLFLVQLFEESPVAHIEGPSRFTVGLIPLVTIMKTPPRRSSCDRLVQVQGEVVRCRLPSLRRISTPKRLLIMQGYDSPEFFHPLVILATFVSGLFRPLHRNFSAFCAHVIRYQAAGRARAWG